MQKDYPYALIQFYVTGPYDCSYLPDQRARSQVATPNHIIDAPVYSELVRNGFRRSGVFTYRPYCDHCRACVPVRIPVERFTPNRAQRRATRRHHTLTVREHPLVFNDAHYALYQAYQLARHAGGGMDQDSSEQYTHFLLQSHVDTRLIEFREDDVLRMVCIIDRLTDGLSSVYTFYDPAVRGASYGTWGVLWQIEVCRQLNLPYLYLGYWIRDSRKMAYKGHFHPLEGRIAGQWRVMKPADLA
ncbi:MAG: arginyltransferase [Rhodocyclaceae bacterium]|nr:arginyltransferase [Rhodocyclaceae bacterium]MCB1963060.1 arginyltransferase [Rhodocyclaceae bacterium]